MNQGKQYIQAVVLVGIIMILSVYAPTGLSEYQDRSILGKVYIQQAERSHSRYRYELSDWDRAFIFSNARENLAAKERYTTSSLKMETLRIEKLKSEYTPVNAAFALLANEKGPGSNELSRQEAVNACRQQIEKLKSMGVLPALAANEQQAFTANLYSVVNIAEASKNLSVWELSDSAGVQFALDAETGKIYSFQVQPDKSFSWDSLDTDDIIEAYCDYLGISGAKQYTRDDMTERTPFFKKYIVKNKEERGEEIVITIGFNPGNHLFFIRIP